MEQWIMSDERANHEHRIRVSAYHLWEDDGRPDGQESEHWERAEKLCERDLDDRIQDAGLLSNNNSKMFMAPRSPTGEPDVPRYLNYKA